MRRPRVTINAAVLATAIRVHARLETDIRTAIARDDRFRAIAEKLRRPPRPHRVARVGIDNIDIIMIDMELFETICRAPRRAAAADRRRTLRRLFNDRPIFLRTSLLHFRASGRVLSSHEHIALSSEIWWIGLPARENFRSSAGRWLYKCGFAANF